MWMVATEGGFDIGDVSEVRLANRKEIAEETARNLTEGERELIRSAMALAVKQRGESRVATLREVAKVQARASYRGFSPVEVMALATGVHTVTSRDGGLIVSCNDRARQQYRNDLVDTMRAGRYGLPFMADLPGMVNCYEATSWFTFGERVAVGLAERGVNRADLIGFAMEVSDKEGRLAGVINEAVRGSGFGKIN